MSLVLPQGKYGAAMDSPYECPKCSSNDTRLIYSVANFGRMFLGLLLNLVFLLLLQSGTDGKFFPPKRKCRKCRTNFVEPAEARGPRRQLDECWKCKYSLIGNASGVCPECGWKLTRRHRRFLRKRGTAEESKLDAADRPGDG